MNRGLLWFVAGLTTLFLTLVGVIAARGATPALPAHPAELLPLIAIAVVSEALIVADDENDGGHVLSFSATAHVATAILFGPVPAAAVAVVGVVAVDGVRMVHPRWIALNASMFGGAILVSGLLYQTLGGTTGRVDSGSAFALLALVIARPLINSAIYATGSRVAAGGRWIVGFGANVRENAAASIGEASLGVVLASAYSGQRWIVLPFLVPLLASLYSSSSTLARLKRETAAALRSFARVIDQRDPNTALHSERVSQYVAQFVELIGLPERESQQLVAAARFHDLGKVAVDVSTLSSNRRLTETELRAIRSHPRLSARLLAPFYFAREMATFVELHHERFDGVGYYNVPVGEIPIEAHVLIVADSFDAMTSDRAYRPALSPAEAAAELRHKAGTQFHPVVAPVFAAMIEGADPREAVGEVAFDALRGSFSRIPVVPAVDWWWLRTLPAIGASLTTAALVAPVIAPGWMIPPVAAAAVMADAVMVLSLLARHRSRTTLARCLEAGEPPAAALRAAGLDADVLVLRWDPNADAYLVDDPGDGICDLLEREEVGSRALRVFPVAGRLASGKCLWLNSDDEWDVRTAVLTSEPLDRWQRTQAAAVARWVADRTPRVAREQHETPADRVASAPEPGMLLVHLEGFEQIRMTAGHLVARSVVVAAMDAVRDVLRGDDRLIHLGENVLGIAMRDQRAAPHVKRRVKDCLATVAVPARAEALRPRFEDVPAEQEGQAA